MRAGPRGVARDIGAMAWLVAENVSAHTFRASRRRMAVEKKEKELQRLWSQIASLESELSEWWSWWRWYGSASVHGGLAWDGQDGIQRGNLALEEQDGNAKGSKASEKQDEIKYGDAISGVQNANKHGGAASKEQDVLLFVGTGSDDQNENKHSDAASEEQYGEVYGSMASEEQDVSEYGITATEEQDGDEYGGTASKEQDVSKCGDVPPTTFLENINVVRRELRRLMVISLPKEVFDDSRRSMDRTAFLSEVAAQMGALAKRVPAGLREPVLQHVGHDVSRIFETLEDCVVRCGVRHQQEWPRLCAKERLYWQTKYDREKAAYDEAYHEWRHGGSQHEPKRPSSPFFAWMRSKADKRWEHSKLEAASLVAAD